jgi:diphthamide synthase (EF-2-diphthine--ammonia ligase)
MASNGTEKIKAFSSWSGGKDSFLACFKALEQGYNVQYLLNIIPKDSRPIWSHGLGSKLLHQTWLIGIPMVQRRLSTHPDEMKQEYLELLRELKSLGLNTLILGDVSHQDQAVWTN